MDDLIREFVEETMEGLASVELDLVEMERTPDDPARIDNLFRIVHTIKGTCSFIGLVKLGSLAHAAENVLGLMREKELAATPGVVSAVLDSMDCIRDLLGEIEATGKEPDVDTAALIDRLERIANGEDVDVAATEPGADAMDMADDDGSADMGAGEDADDGEEDIASVIHKLMMAKEAADMDGDESVDTGFDLPAGDDAANEMSADEAVPETAESAEDDDGGNPLFATLADILNGTAPAANGRQHPAETQAPVARGSRPREVKAARPKEVPATTPVAKAPVAKAPAKSPAPAAAPAAANNGFRSPAEDSEDTGDKARGDAKAVGTQSLRVNVELLEQLMTLVSELVLTRNQLLQLIRGKSDSDFHLPLQRLSQVTSELQEGVMKTRMQPIGNAWNKLPRIVRDLSLDLGKQITLHMDGAETELDRQVLEMIKDPLTHMVRNSADHGIEMPDVRRLAGKSDEGHIFLSARHEGGHIVIELSDDGAGLDADAIRRRIIERGLISAVEAEGLNEQQLFSYIFAPGFSTAASVTSVSGRGVGMDVVRTNIEKIGGSIDLQSRQGLGTSFIIKIPLTLAIVSALIVESAGERFAVPQISVQELVRVNGSSRQQIEQINGANLLRLRERLLPLISLGQVLQLDDTDIDTLSENKSELFVVVMQLGAQEFGIIVDQVFDTEEIVVKPVAPILRDIREFSGNTILGDGSVIMILDPNGLAANMSTKALDHADAGLDNVEETGGSKKIPMLVFEAGNRAPKAIPLSLVDRLEEFDAERFEEIDGRVVVQYRGSLMPIVSVGAPVSLDQPSSPVIVFSDQGTQLGLVVDRIIDISHEEVRIDLGNLSEGFMGTIVVNGKAAEVVDISHHLQQAYPERYGALSKPYEPDQNVVPASNILLVDDSSFFRNVVSPLLRSHGFNLSVAEHPEEALDLLDAGHTFDVIVSDIEMPGMDGYALLKRFQAHPASASTPVIALSSHGSTTDHERGLKAGFVGYVTKLDKNGLLNAIEMAARTQEIAA